MDIHELFTPLYEERVDDIFTRAYRKGNSDGFRQAKKDMANKTVDQKRVETGFIDPLSRGRITRANVQEKAYRFGFQDGYYDAITGGHRSDESVNEEDYRGQHQAPGSSDGAPLWDVTRNGIYPEDFYTNIYDYTMGAGDGVVGSLYNYKNRPNRAVTVYRAVPHEETTAEAIRRLERELKRYMARRIVPEPYAGSSGFERESEWYEMASNELERLQKLPQENATRYPINPGDWVTLSKRYAHEHGRANLRGKYKIISKKVFARDVYTDGNSLEEWGYEPTPRV